ncbi:MAG: hypothetical protein WC942_11550 [Clostridia bacterium]|jgi:hypothetical protein
MGLKFTCPKCGKNKLDCVENVNTVNSEITDIDEEGNFEYGEMIITGDYSEVSHFECVDCGFIPQDSTDSDINDNLDLVEWIKEHCTQE